jgi:hypothetical protein
MFWLSHRGNLDGPNPELENSVPYVQAALERGFDVKIDVWSKNGALFTGNDGPLYPISIDFLAKERVWCQARDITTLVKLLTDYRIHCFWLDKDTACLTSMKYLWTLPGHKLTSRSICVFPELAGHEGHWHTTTQGVCSDRIAAIR